MALSEKELKELHQIELNILKEFIKICESKELRYYLLGGSCLGSVRHQGFIPWDDDIDVGMPRKDYETFMEIAQDLMPKHLFLQTRHTDEEYNNIFSKIRDNRTTFIEESVKNRNMNHGVYIDIFPLDGCGNTEKEAKKIFRRYSVLNEIYHYKEGNQPKNGIRNIIRNAYYWVKSLKYKSSKKVRDQIELYCSSNNYEISNYVCNYYGMWREKEIAKKDWFSEGSKAPFEKIEVTIPRDSHNYLTKLYGNYMELPPISKRKAPHCYRLDLNNSYKKYIKDEEK